MRSRFIAILAMLFVAGCASYAQRLPPLTTEADAIAVHGQPTRRWDNGDGTTTLEYSTQPYGENTLMVTVDKGGIVLEQHDALSDRNLGNVKRGMTKDEVSRLLGTHRSVQTFQLSGEEVWDWNIYNEGPGIATLFNVHFVDGKVVRTSRTYVYPTEGVFGGPMFGYPYPYYAYPFPYRSRWRHRYPYWSGYPWYW